MSKKQAARKETEKPAGKKDSSKSLKGGVGESEEIRLTRERELVDSLNRENMMRYLQGLAPSTEAEGLVRQASSTAVQKVTQRLQRGQLSIAENPPPLPPKGPPPPKLSPQEQLELQLKAQREQLQRKIDYLQEQIRSDPSKGGEESPLHVQLKEVLSKQEHERRVRQIATEKAERKRKLEEMQQQEERRAKEEREREEELKKIADEKQKQRKRKQIESKMQSRKEQHEQFLKQQAELQKSLATVKQKERLYERMEQRYQSEVVLPSLEEKKSRLKQLRDFHSRYDLEAVRQHEKKYRSAHSPQSIHQGKAQESTWVPPQRSQKMSKLLQEEEQMIKDKLEEKQRRAEDRARRQESFLSELKQKHQPKLDTEKRTEIQRRLEEQLKEQLRKKERNSIDGRKLGEDYLELARKMGRSASLRTSAVQSRTTEQQLHTSRPTPNLNPHRSDEFYQQVRRRKIDQIVTASASPQQKYHLLRMETQKLGEKIRQAQQKGGADKQGELLLSSIKAKMGIMQLMRKQ